jgi:epoxyqueuosine reductase
MAPHFTLNYNEERMSRLPNEKIQEVLKSQGFERFGFARLENPVSLNIYKQWLDDGFNGEMDYLKRHLEFKETPQLLLRNACSAVSVAQPYFPHPRPHTLAPGLKIAMYAQGADYHHWFKENLEQTARKLKEQFKDHEFLCSTDSAPVLERDLAYRAGLGWVGKNTCLIDEKAGSLFFIGQILTTLDFAAELNPLAADRCGTCTRCIDVCPTGALVEPRKLDARKCISYLTIESKNPPAGEFREKIGAHYFGCDICQSVCPWNTKVFGASLHSNKPSRNETVEDLRKILTLSASQIEKIFRGTALSRGSAFRHRANAMVVAANLGLKELTAEIQALKHSQPKLEELAEWCLRRLGEGLTLTNLPTT